MLIPRDALMFLSMMKAALACSSDTRDYKLACTIVNVFPARYVVLLGQY